MKPLHHRTDRMRLAIALLLAATGASAQQAGLYEGVTDQGQLVQLQINTDVDGGNPRLTFVQVVYQVDCPLSGRRSLDGYAVGASVPLNRQGGFARHLYTARYWANMRATFDGVDTFSGSTSLYGAKLLAQLPVQAESCGVVGVSFQARLRPGAQPTDLGAAGWGLDSLTTGRWLTGGSLADARTRWRP